ncbi:MAG: bile acid:sodium symporter family protein [Phenylobacterium sp.]|uniref:bile acid:sodium symporter family protein n=1 Tax=Phenylobacterium sp. TaxID=1871053 RepID=UPI002A36E0BE|nr:bile acid:sodium symporter family protein [Phenylobacterium sp.]MDX9998240.1 bile acid:sodium symporter family protein [Phenylobacterium sp.]
MKSLLARLSIDWYLLAIVGMVALASILPARGETAEWTALATKVGIALVFFLHGAKLSREAVVAGMIHWRLHVLVLGVTFVVFPLAGIGLAALPAWITPPALAAGLVYLACLPSTIQSAIGFTAIARGNVAAAVCGASASNLLGIVITPLLVGTLLSAEGGISFSSVEAILWQLLAPFVAGQLVHPFVGGFMRRYAKPLQLVDRGSILLVVYNAFSGAVVAGIWSQVSIPDLARLTLICLVLLAASLGLCIWLARLRGFSVEDEATIVFGGSNKSLAAGVPMAGALFPAATMGFVLLPVMLYHQFQLMACAAIAQRYAKRAPSE